MTHTIEDKTNLIEQAKRLRGQAETIEALLGKSINVEEVISGCT